MADFINLELKHEGYEVDICYDGEQGYEKTIQNNYDIILLDIMIPKINVQELINEIIEETKIIETNRNIYSSNNEECYIYADMSNVKELIRIFIDNAIKYTEENGEINIFSQKDNGKIYINIQDNVIGIAEEEQENIFDRFYRIDKSRNKETGGVGLGLAIAKSIANMNDVEIKLESKQGKGSTFTFIFAESLGH